MPSEWTASFVRGLNKGVAANYKYVWGGYDPTKFIWDTKKKRKAKGLDCSGFAAWAMEDEVNRAAREAGIPGVRRTTSARMARGLDGWAGVDHPGDNADSWLLNAAEGDLAWTFSDYGHVGGLLCDPATGAPGYAHASPTRGVVRDDIKATGWPIKDFSKVRRLTIGDKK